MGYRATSSTASTGGFTKDARYEAERADVALTLVPLPKLRKRVVDSYDRLDSGWLGDAGWRERVWPSQTARHRARC